MVNEEYKTECVELLKSNFYCVKNFLHKLFGDDFELKVVSPREGEFIKVTEENYYAVHTFFCCLGRELHCNPKTGTLYDYAPKEATTGFKKVRTNAWSFNTLFRSFLLKGWMGWFNVYNFQVLEKGMRGSGYGTISKFTLADWELC